MNFLTNDFISPQASAALLMVALTAAWNDWFHWRIPNRLLAAGCAAAVMFAAFAFNAIGLKDCLVGGLLGFVMMWPFYWMGGMAAGDVKLMATLGLFAGPALIVDVALMSFIVGGVWSVVVLIARTTTGTLINTWIRAASSQLPKLPERRPPPTLQKNSRAVIPYGVVIALGVMGTLALHGSA